MLYGVQKEQPSQSPNTNEQIEALPFRLGEYGPLDTHVSYSAPLNLESDSPIELDLDNDGSAEFKLILDAQVSNLLIHASFLVESSTWQIAAIPIIDSIFYCSDSSSNTPHLSNYYYNKGALTCQGIENVFVRTDSLSSNPLIYNKGKAMDSIQNWMKNICLHKLHIRQSPSYFQHFESPFYLQFPTTHFLALKQETAAGPQYAWLSIQVDAIARPWQIRVHEYAVEHLP